MFRSTYRSRATARLLAILLLLLLAVARAGGTEPPALNPFAPRQQTRADALPGYAELSDGSLVPGRLYLTRDTRLKIQDRTSGRQREVPLDVVQRIECLIEKEWQEREWRFKENANNEKVYTGRRYPARQYVHKITLQDGRSIEGPLSGVLYVEPYDGSETRKLLLHKRQKGPIGSDLDSLVYLRTVALGEEALADARRKAAARQAASEAGQGRAGF